MKFRIVHKTEYSYQTTVSQCHNLAHLRPRTLPTQQCLGHRLQIDPLPLDLAEHEDFFGNHVSYFSIQQPHRTLTVTATSEVRLDPANGQLALDKDMPWDEVRVRLAEPHTDTARENRQFVLDSPLAGAAPELSGYAAASFPPGRPLLEAVRDLMERVHNEFTYDPEFSTVSTPLTDVLINRRGVCQDFAHLAIACLRSLGLAARYVSGYLETCRRQASPNSRVPTSRTPGSRSTCPMSAGMISTPPTTGYRWTSTSPRPGDGTMPTSRRSRACCSVAIRDTGHGSR